MKPKRPTLRLVPDVVQPANLSAPDALRVIRELAAVSANVHRLVHGKARGRQRGISLEDVVRVLSRGVVTEGPYIAPKSGNWRLNVTGRSAGDEITCVVEIEWRSRLLIVTVF